ncbi:MAG: TonB-dependent receptor family protein [Bacteroides sp.]|nr:TonB-dependent receptor family protein [Bacteroides sp.]
MRTILILISCFYTTLLFSQQFNIKGTVKDKTTTEAIEFATVVLLRKDSTLVAGGLTEKDGTFKLNNIPKGSYILQISYVGYDMKSVPTTHAADVGDVFLVQNNTLEEVTVVGNRPFFQQQIDKYVINVANNLVTAGRNALDVLRNTPGVFVQNKSISLMGGSVAVWIDGRPSQMSGEQLASFLEGMQGENIDSIEVITNPSSKFDAGGSGGIINIKLKKNKIDTFNGMTNVGYKRSKTDLGIAGLSLNYRKNKVSLYGNYNFRVGNDTEYNHELTSQTSGNKVQSYDKELDSDLYRTVSHNYRVGMDISLSQSDILGFMLNGYDSDNRANLLSQTVIVPPLDDTSLSNMNGKYKSKSAGQMYNINYQHKFAKEGQELSTDLDFARFSNTQRQNQLYSFYREDNVEAKPGSSERSYLPQKNKIWSVRIDYKQPWFKNASFETGIKYGQTKTDNDINYEEMINNTWQNDETRSNYFKYDERILAAHYSFRHKIGKWMYQVGLRTEYTYQKGNQITSNEENKKSYWDLFPTAFLLYEPSEKHSFILSYTRRFNRPDFELLNPFEIALDKYSFRRGNPDLNPSYGNIINLKYIYRGKLAVTFNITDLEDRIFLEPTVEESGRYGYTWGNFGRRTAYILEISYNNVFFKRWRMNTMGQLAYVNQDAGKAVTNFDNNGLSGFWMFNNNFEITKTLSAEINYMMMPGIRYGYTKSESLYNNLSFGIRQQILKGKGSVSLSINDIFNGTLDKSSSAYNNIKVQSYTNNNLRSLTVSFSYRFGSDKVKGARNRNTGIDEEASRSRSK